MEVLLDLELSAGFRYVRLREIAAEGRKTPAFALAEVSWIIGWQSAVSMPTAVTSLRWTPN
jgi:hypothetical protein